MITNTMDHKEVREKLLSTLNSWIGSDINDYSLLGIPPDSLSTLLSADLTYRCIPRRSNGGVLNFTGTHYLILNTTINQYIIPLVDSTMIDIKDNSIMINNIRKLIRSDA